MNLRSHEQYLAIEGELEPFKIPIEIESLKKHIKISYNLSGKSYMHTISRGKGVGFREVRNTRALTRRHLREAGILTSPEETTNEQENMMSQVPVTLTERNLEVVGHEPRMRDLDVAAALGYAGRPDNIRQLIRSNQDELRRYGDLPQVDKQGGTSGGRPSQFFMLNREQCILVAMFSRTTQAADVREQVVRAFTDWENHHGAGQSMLPPPSPEIMLNEPAIEAVATAVAQRVAAPEVPQIEGLLRTDEFKDIMHDLVDWERNQFMQISRTLREKSAPQGVSEEIEKLLDRKITASLRAVSSHLEEVVSARVGSSTSAITTQLANQVRDIAASMDRVLSAIDTINQRISQGSVAETKAVEAPVVEAQPEPAPEPIRQDILSRSVQVPVRTSGMVGMEDIYAMIGVNPKSLNDRQSLSMKMRYSLEKYARRRRIDPVRVTKYGITRAYWPKEMIADWYRRSGAGLIMDHVSPKSRPHIA